MKRPAMVRIKIYAEIEVVMEVDIEGLREDALEYEIQQKKTQVHEAFTQELEKAFGLGLRRIDYIEFEVLRGSGDE